MKEITSEAEFRRVVEESTISVIDFFTTWCVPCKIVAPVLEALSKEYENDDGTSDVHFFKVDCDTLDSVADELDIQSIPTIALFVKGGKMVDSIVGNRPKDIIKHHVDEVIQQVEQAGAGGTA